MTINASSQEKLLIIGCGDIGQRLAQQLDPLHYRITGLRRHPPEDLPYLQYRVCNATQSGQLDALLGSDETLSGRFEPPLVNVGVGEDLSIRELAETIRQVTGYQGEIVFDRSKPDGTPRKLMDVSCLSALGFQPTVSLREGLRRALADAPYAKAQVSLA